MAKPILLTFLAALILVGDLHAESSLRFYGNGVAAPTFDRVVVSLDAPARPIDVGAGDFTVEFFLRAAAGSNSSTATCAAVNDSWIEGNIVVDRDVFGDGDFGDFGLSLMSGRLAFGVNNGSAGTTACGSSDVRDGFWHHVAATRRASDGLLQVFLDGTLEAQVTGPTGNLSYRDGRSGMTWDPYLVFGAEKHDAGAAYPSFSGWLDEIRVSATRRYNAPFLRPTSPFTPDAATVALYNCDEGSGTTLGDSSGAAGGPSPGQLRVGGNPAGPAWSTDSPFAAIFADGFESGNTAAWSLTAP